MSAPVKQPVNETAKQILLDDFFLACLSREASLLGRKEVLTGKAKFGIFGDGKELAQIAMARQFKKGDWRSGYYRDQTFMMAIGELTVKQYFAGLYAHTDVEKEPSSGGRQMGGHFSTRFIDQNGNWKNVMESKNSSSDISPTGGQMPRLLGLAQASKLYRQNEKLHHKSQFSNKGNEVAFGTIGDSSTSEGLFWETMNAAAVLGVPMCMCVWDNGWGISVPKKYQTAKESISESLSGMESEPSNGGIKIFRVKGWDYAHLQITFDKAVKHAREFHQPVLIHVDEITQPQGHSTSGSHERYKSKELLSWYETADCIVKFSEFIVEKGVATHEDLNELRTKAKNQVRIDQRSAWDEFVALVQNDVNAAKEFISNVASAHENISFEAPLELIEKAEIRKDVFSAVRLTIRLCRGAQSNALTLLKNWYSEATERMHEAYSSHLIDQNSQFEISIPPTFNSSSEWVDGRIILRDFWDKKLSEIPEVLIFGEDVGKIGGVNQTCEGLQEKHGEHRVSDTGIREATIVGQAIGLAMRGLRPVAEIQYLDYIYYALQIMRDDLATVRYRTAGGQMSPAIISTRGHRLEGIWHSGSPMGAIIHSVRGMHVCVPRNMTQAAGMYNNLLRGNDPAIVVECLNGYRKKEQLPENLGEYIVPLGFAEIVRSGSDLTVVSYGSTLHLCIQASEELSNMGINIEVIDAQTLLPFDKTGICASSVQKTNRLLIVDEDVPGGASAYLLDQIINKQGAFQYLDAQPDTLTSKEHLPAYSTDGDYFSKPSIDDIVEKVYGIMHESNPKKFPKL
jgi:2-oxoisovalerate dehydrogenase E1 component